MIQEIEDRFFRPKEGDRDFQWLDILSSDATAVMICFSRCADASRDLDLWHKALYQKKKGKKMDGGPGSVLFCSGALVGGGAARGRVTWPSLSPFFGRALLLVSGAGLGAWDQAGSVSPGAPAVDRARFPILAELPPPLFRTWAGRPALPWSGGSATACFLPFFRPPAVLSLITDSQDKRIYNE